MDKVLKRLHQAIDDRARVVKSPGKRFYIYLHTNGALIMKPGIVVDNDPRYFDRPFVSKVWRIETWNDARAFVKSVYTDGYATEAELRMFF